MAGKILNYFAGGNTAKGFHSLHDSNLMDLNVFIYIKVVLGQEILADENDRQRMD